MEIYGKTERALSAFLTGERISLLYAATSELFPLPLNMQEPRIPSPRKLRIAKPADVAQHAGFPSSTPAKKRAAR